MTDAPLPVLFIHGLWLHPLSWARWAARFRAVGYQATAPGWPGVLGTVEATRAQPDALATAGIVSATSHYAAIIGGLPARPVVVGHSLGGLIAEGMLSQHLVAAAIAIDSVPIGDPLPLPHSALRTALSALRDPAARQQAVSLTALQFRDSIGSAVSSDESDVLYRRWCIPAPARALFEPAADFTLSASVAASAPVDHRGPLLRIMGGQDHDVPEAVIRAELDRYRRPHAVNDLIEFPHRGHSLTIDRGWRSVAGVCLDWLYKRGL
jgi:pimeloyl-ACP methyl ester carboxylesterase